MNKKIIISCILGISTMMLMTGCGRQTEEPQDEIEVISVNIDEDTPNITEMSKSKILSLSASEVKQSVETYLPNYRTIYKISNSKVMTDEDWLNLRDIICIQFYGNATLDTTSSSNSIDNNAKYYNPDKESIKKMSASEFATYMNGLYTYMYGKDYLTSNNIDFTQYSEDKINILKQDFLNNLDKTN